MSRFFFLCFVACLTFAPFLLNCNLSKKKKKDSWLSNVKASSHHRKEVLQHKTFHRYTVRAKRGTAQGLRDSQNRSHMPKSAGAALRRHNEAALVKARLFVCFTSVVARSFLVLFSRVRLIFCHVGNDGPQRNVRT